MCEHSAVKTRYILSYVNYKGLKQKWHSASLKIVGSSAIDRPYMVYVWPINGTTANDLMVTSAEEGGYVFGSVCLSVCLSVCPSDYSQTCERILTKFFGG